jgi:hypothetical protein
MSRFKPSSDKAPSKFQRGIAPDLLFSQVRNTMPCLFDSKFGQDLEEHFPPARTLREFEKKQTEPLSHVEYFRLCLSSHYLTVATPVPTDVDNQIRQKLWPKSLPLEWALEMADLVITSHGWDFARVTGRYAYGAKGSSWEKEVVHGHLGEWFTVACGAYCAMRQYEDPLARERAEKLLDAIAGEVNRHSEIFGSLWRAQEGLGALKASAALAHNFGDLDRVMDMWELPVNDPLRLGFYKLGVTPFDPDKKLRYLGRLWVAGELYKSVIDGSSMALENHRHYALRKPKCLRKSPSFMIATGPFFDDWGKAVAQGLANSDGSPSDETREVLEVLKNGWDRQPKTLGYGRALRSFFELHPELPRDGIQRAQEMRQILNTPQERFEKLWSEEAVRLMDEIPSRA